ncbi:MAG: LysR family transcriptional regulator, partial [Rhodoferax sp.]
MKKQLPAQLQLAEALGQPSADKRIDILRRIGQVGSISEAARGAGVSYKAAWQAVDTLGNLAGVALLERLVGGSGGGGARLTPAG